MPILKHDVAIIGAGPAGILASIEPARSGFDVQVFEEHESIGKPDHCAGLLSTSGLRTLGLQPPKEVIQNQVIGAKIFSPSGKSILIERGQREALVVNRVAFDRWLAQKAMNNGVKIQTSSKIMSVRKYGDDWMAYSKEKNGENQILARKIVNAEGVRGQISRMIGFPYVPRKNKMLAYQFEMKNVDTHEDLVEMYYDNRIAPGFFAWLIPLGEGKARVGLAARDYSKTRLKAAIKHHPILGKHLHRAQIERGFGGVVLVGLPIRRTVRDDALVVGDAAGVVKATTGGGVIFGGIMSKLAGTYLKYSLDSAPDGQKKLEKFEHVWRSFLMKDLYAMYVAQKFIGSLTNKGLDSLIGDAAELGLIGTVKQEGDMDRQGRVITKLLGNPKTILAGLKAIRYIKLNV
ncbi:MAG: hypothetical protein BAJATHORv1_20095 [Candidatus Thorarchaeota archaeon]|nr:MAG: hypothetical protein BAJATHORv1_20095 [Candidatus Thorarchaeota archaeon]